MDDSQGQRWSSPYLGDLGLLSDLWLASRLLPVDLVSVNPASELVCQPEKPEAGPVCQLLVAGKGQNQTYILMTQLN